MSDVREWQAGPGRVDYLGVPLRADGDLGPKTRWAMYLDTLSPWRQSAVRAFLTLRGLREQGDNRGTLPDFVLRLAGTAPGQSWCAATYSWALWVAGLCQRTGFHPNASVLALRGALRPVPFEQVQPGDFASLVHPDGVHGHGGMVLWPGVDWVASIDANISDQVDVIRYRATDRQYFSPDLGGFAARPGEPPESILLYGSGKDR